MVRAILTYALGFAAAGAIHATRRAMLGWAPSRGD